MYKPQQCETFTFPQHNVHHNAEQTNACMHCEHAWNIPACISLPSSDCIMHGFSKHAGVHKGDFDTNVSAGNILM